MFTISKDPLGNATWLFWGVGVVGMLLLFGTLFGLNFLAVTGERGIHQRDLLTASRAGLNSDEIAIRPPTSNTQPEAIEALGMTWKMAGPGVLAIFLITGINLWFQKRPYRISEDPVRDFVDPRAAGRKYK